jgi:[ribosomal protein S5]-alanine N-acetyltransferase
VREVLRTERLLLRELTLDDAGALLRILGDPITMAHYPRAFTPPEVEMWIVKNMDRYRTSGFGLWAMIRRSDGMFVGECGLVEQQVEGTTEVEVGWHVARSLWRRGYAAEAAAACRDHAFGTLGVDRLVSLILPANVASQGVARRIGMVPDRVVVHAGKDHLLFARRAGAGADPVERTRSAYDRLAADYGRADARDFTAAARREFTEGLPPGAVILDLGCGPGRDAAPFGAAGFRVVGIDLSEAMARRALTSGASIVVGDARRIPLATSSADAVWASASLLHLPKAETPRALGEIVRVLAPGGRVFVTVKEGRDQAWRVTEGEPRFFSFFAPDELDDLLHGAGLTIERAWRTPDPRGREPWLERLAQVPRSSVSTASRPGTTR